jgi:hypothetical protein
MQTALAHFAGVDRTIGGFEGLEVAQNAISTNETKDAFAADYQVLIKALGVPLTRQHSGPLQCRLQMACRRCLNP